MSLPNKKDALGKGIRSLLQNIDSDLKNTAGALSQEVVEQASSAMPWWRSWRAQATTLWC